MPGQLKKRKRKCLQYWVTNAENNLQFHTLCFILLVFDANARDRCHGGRHNGKIEESKMTSLHFKDGTQVQGAWKSQT